MLTLSCNEGNKKILEEAETSTEHTELIVFHPQHKLQKVHVPLPHTGSYHERWDFIESREDLFGQTSHI